MQQDISSLLAGLQGSFPFNIVFITQQNLENGTTPFSSACSCLQQVNRSGIPRFYSFSDVGCDHSLDCRKACPLQGAFFYPVYNGSIWLGTLCARPDPAHKLQDNFGTGRIQLEVLFPLISSYLSSCHEEERLKRENGILKQEMRNILGFAREMWLIAGAGGQVMEVSQHFCSLIGLSRTNLIGEDVTAIMRKEDWERLSHLPDQAPAAVELTCFHDDTLSRQAGPALRCAVQVGVIYEGNNKESLVLLFSPQVHEGESRGDRPRPLYTFDEIIGISPTIHAARELARRIAPGETTVMLRGESGTGKEIFAQAIHMGSSRARGPFIAINCAAIPDTLLESELFGYERGAFTGAQGKAKPGRFELAGGGTIFLDEIGDMSLSLQAKLLRVVQDRKLERLGGTGSLNVDVRIIAATHRRLEEMVAMHKFREDLYYRLNVIPLTIPPLRERKEDIPLLVEHFMKSPPAAIARLPKRLSREVWDALLNYAWPGNIRELKNVVEHFMQLEIGDLVTTHSLPLSLQKNGLVSIARQETPRKGGEAEKEKIITLLDHYGRDVAGKQQVAVAMGWSLPTLYRKLKKYKIN